ncbi:uncharacterized protein B0J16DRAFT_336255, partial [Fusarium flagelliforme]|uniref:uncharacterized protein n=1 Tax=Fusarium flagelliforme TaxID=2675880 RepID=UPI001E8D2A93
MKIVFLRKLVPSPRRRRKIAPPIRRRLSHAIFVITCRFPDIPISLRIITRRSRFLEPSMLTGCVVDNKIKNNLQTAFMTLCDENVNILDASIGFVNLLIIGYVVAHITLWAFKDWRNPYDVNSQVVKIIKLGNETGQVAPAVAVGIFEACWVDLV